MLVALIDRAKQIGARWLTLEVRKSNTVAQALAYEYAELFRGLGDDELIELADSFALAKCEVRTTLLDQMRAG